MNIELIMCLILSFLFGAITFSLSYLIGYIIRGHYIALKLALSSEISQIFARQGIIELCAIILLCVVIVPIGTMYFDYLTSVYTGATFFVMNAIFFILPLVIIYAGRYLLPRT